MQMSRIDFRTVRRSVQESRLSARPTIFPSGRQAVNIMRSVSSIFAASRRLAALGLCLGLAACGSSQNWQDNSQFVTVGGNVAGFTGGSLAVWNNGGDRLAIADNGSFRFPLKIASGSTYSVVVATQPAGQTCTVSNGSGTARSDVTSVAVNCVPYTFTRRSLPAIYTTGKAINYSPYRTEGGPITSEVPSDLDILQDLTLLNTAGFNLLRLFGAKAPATDVVAEKILRIAAQTFPDMKFQLGLDLKGLTSCSDPANDFNIAYLISNLSKYPNVVTISVGNETSFFSKFMPLPCLEGYIRTIRAQVPQPVTSDDDWTFYAGLSGGGGDRVPVKPDTILPLIDFASIHMYPFSYTVWDWRQTSVPAGPDRAQAMMEQSLVALKEWYGEVVDYRYVGADGVTVSVGDSMPITVGETGWKARQTNPAAEIEQYAALPPNQKWYFDLLYGNPGGYESWQGSVGGPPTIFFFQGYDEQWKGIDDGWGLWNIDRQARYALCGTPAGPACNDDLYEGAGFYNPASFPFSTITFDSPTTTYTLQGFGGAEDSQVVTESPASTSNRAARVNRSAIAETFAGTVVATTGGLIAGTIPFDESNTRMTVRVYSPAAGIPVRLKVEDSADTSPDPKVSGVEVEAVTTVANGWETLTFDFADPAAGSLNLGVWTYNRVIIFFNFGAKGEDAGAQTYYFDDITFIGGGGIAVVPFSDISFDSAGGTYTLLGFGGAEDSSLQPDPTDAGNTAARVNRSATAQVFAGTIVSTGANNTAGTIPFTASNTRMSVRVYSPAVGITVRLKVEDSADTSPDPKVSGVETDATTTVANGWETLTFDFSNPAAGSLDPAVWNYDRVIIFFDFGSSGADIGARTYYFDDVNFVAGSGSGSGSTGTCTSPCIDFASASVKYQPFEGLVSAEQSGDPVDASNKVAKFVKGPTGQPWAGATVYTIDATQSVPEFDLSGSKIVTLRVYSPVAGMNIRMKLEDAGNNAIYLEKDVLTTKANEWETLSFDFATPVNGVYDAANTYDRVSLFPAFSVTAPPASNVTVYFDELDYITK
jgi:exo-beta-1,3-glucanase (GH17 family)